MAKKATIPQTLGQVTGMTYQACVVENGKMLKLTAEDATIFSNVGGVHELQSSVGSEPPIKFRVEGGPKKDGKRGNIVLIPISVLN